MSKSNEIEKYMAVYRHEENASHFIPRFLDTKHQYIIFKIYPRLATLNREKTKLGKRRRRFSSIGSEAGRASRFLERAASQREKRREERGKRNPEAKLLRPFLSASQTAAKGNTLYMPTTFPKCSVQFFAATSADPDERVTHVASMQGRTRTCPSPSPLSLSQNATCARVRSFCTGCLSRIDRAWGVKVRERGEVGGV